MKEMTKAYLILIFGIPALLVLSCVFFGNIPFAGALVYAIPVIMLAFFMSRLFAVNPRRKAIHIAAGFLCMIGTWFLSVIVTGAFFISRTGLEGTQ